MSFWFSLVISSPVITSTSAPAATCAMRVGELLLLTRPVSATTAIESN